MPTARELAEMREAKKLAQAGFNPDGSPIEAGGQDDDDHDEGQGFGGNESDDQDFDDDDDDGIDYRARAQELERQLAATQGRVAPSQQQAQEYRDLWDQERAKNAQLQRENQERIDALQQQLDERNNHFSVEDVLTEDERADIDPSVLNTVVKLADALVQRRLPKVDVRAETLKTLEEREHNRVNEYRARVLTDPGRGLHQLSALSEDPAFLAWIREDDNDMDSVVNSLLQARSTEEVDRYSKIVAKRIVKFKERANRNPDGRTTSGLNMRRQPKAKVTQAELEAKAKEIKRLSRSHRQSDRDRAQQLINELNS